MRLRSFQDPCEAETLDELHQILSLRDEGGFASFWLLHDSGAEMGIMFKGSDAYIHYFPGKGHPGFHPVGPSHDWGTFVSFLADNHEPTSVASAMVVPLSSALGAIDEFFLFGTKSTAIEWESL